jgi:hypothetical protein
MEVRVRPSDLYSRGQAEARSSAVPGLAELGDAAAVVELDVGTVVVGRVIEVLLVLGGNGVRRRGARRGR